MAILTIITIVEDDLQTENQQSTETALRCLCLCHSTRTLDNTRSDILGEIFVLVITVRAKCVHADWAYKSHVLKTEM